MTIAIIGGGIAGLSAAFHLSTRLPSTRIQIHEASHRLGGWIQSSRSFEEPRVLVEHGPRTLRHTGIPGLCTLELVKMLNLQDELLLVPKSDPSHKNRFIVFPDTLTKLPSSPISLLRAILIDRLEILKGAPRGIISEFFKVRLSSDIKDESIHSFIERRLGPVIANNVVSAVFHGIYAGDTHKLSARSTLKGMWDLEQRYGGLFKGLLRGGNPESKDFKSLRMELESSVGSDILNRFKETSVYSFKQGTETLSRALRERLLSSPNVSIHTESNITRMISRNHGIDITSSEHTFNATHVISTVQGPILHNLIPSKQALPHLNANPAVTVGVVTLAWKEQEAILPVQGFGYLIPQSAKSNDDKVLGCVFDMKGQDSTPLTKVTVMIGGHMWDNLKTLPTQKDLIAIARREVARRLHITDKPFISSANIQKKCIPQYLVGHYDRMQDLHHHIRNSEWNGKLSLAGAAFNGVSVNDCVRIGRQVAIDLANGKEPTGLEQFHVQ